MATKSHPPLMKKHSQSDLVSRLKTRKILGVGGEDDGGEVHRSKISQVLGNEIKFSGREPLGLSCVFCIPPQALTFPIQLYDTIFDEELVGTKMSIRLYGGALLSISLVIWNALYTTEKVIIRWTLLTEACYFGIQFLVTAITLVENGTVSNKALVLVFSRVAFVGISLCYYYQLGRRPKKISRVRRHQPLLLLPAGAQVQEDLNPGDDQTQIYTTFSISSSTQQTLSIQARNRQVQQH
ncbi:UNVERIFIED_CONTAM: hypothetical protein FKN15_018237 [Acipenser sinensis]